MRLTEQQVLGIALAILLGSPFVIVVLDVIAVNLFPLYKTAIHIYYVILEIVVFIISLHLIFEKKMREYIVEYFARK